MMIRASVGNRGRVAFGGELLTSTAKASKPILVKRWNEKAIECELLETPGRGFGFQN